jgi:hypothetical protein
MENGDEIGWDVGLPLPKAMCYTNLAFPGINAILLTFMEVM